MPTHLSSKDLTEALSVLQEFDRTNPATPGMLLMMSELHEKLNQAIEAGDMLERLAASLDEHSDPDVLYWCRVQLGEYAEIDSRFQKCLQQVKVLSQKRREKELPTPNDQRILHTFDVPNELILARRLLRSKIVSPEIYHLILEDLCAPENTRSMSPTTVLHVVQQRALPSQGTLVEYLVQDGSLPMVNLACFSPPPEVFFALPPVFVQHRAACVFGLIGEDAMVAVLNPYNESIQEDAAAIIGRTCHFYLATAAAYDGILRRAVDGVEFTVSS